VRERFKVGLGCHHAAVRAAYLLFKDFFDLGSIETMQFDLVEARFIIYALSEMVYDFSDSSSIFLMCFLRTRTSSS